MDARLPDAFCESVVSLLPTQEPPGRRGGRPAIPHAVVLKVIWFVLTVGCRWKDIPREFGCCGETRSDFISWNFRPVFHEMTPKHSFLGTKREKMILDERGTNVDNAR